MKFKKKSKETLKDELFILERNYRATKIGTKKKLGLFLLMIFKQEYRKTKIIDLKKEIENYKLV